MGEFSGRFDWFWIINDDKHATCKFCREKLLRANESRHNCDLIKFMRWKLKKDR